MTYEIKLQLAVFLLCIAEAGLENVVIKLKNPNQENYVSLNRQEHQWSAVYWFAMVSLFLTVSGQANLWYLLVPTLVTIRRLAFTYGLKIIRRHKFRFIEGDQFIDRLARRIFGEKGGYRELFALILAIAGLNLVMWYL